MKSTLHVVGIGSTQHAETDQDAAATNKGETHQDVDQGGAPERKQVQRPVAVQIHGGRVLVVDGLVNGVDPHVPWRNPVSLTHLFCFGAAGTLRNPQPSHSFLWTSCCL